MGQRKIRVRVTPKSKKESVREGVKGIVHVTVFEDSKKGRANSRVRELLALHYHIPLKRVLVTRGSTTRSKTILLYTDTV